MEKFIKLDWPECQGYEEEEECYWAADGMVLFVPESLYKRRQLDLENTKFDCGHDINYRHND